MLQTASSGARAPFTAGSIPGSNPRTTKGRSMPASRVKAVAEPTPPLPPELAHVGPAPKIAPERLHSLAAHLPNHGVPHRLAYWAAAHMVARQDWGRDVIAQIHTPAMQEVILACRAWAAAQQKVLEAERAKVPFWQRPGYDPHALGPATSVGKATQKKAQQLTQAIRALARANPPCCWVGMGRKEL